MLICAFSPHYQLIYINFDISPSLFTSTDGTAVRSSSADAPVAAMFELTLKILRSALTDNWLFCPVTTTF